MVLPAALIFTPSEPHLRIPKKRKTGPKNHRARRPGRRRRRHEGEIGATENLLSQLDVTARCHSLEGDIAPFDETSREIRPRPACPRVVIFSHRTKFSPPSNDGLIWWETATDVGHVASCVASLSRYLGTSGRFGATVGTSNQMPVKCVKSLKQRDINGFYGITAVPSSNALSGDVASCVASLSQVLGRPVMTCCPAGGRRGCWSRPRGSPAPSSPARPGRVGGSAG